MGSQGKSMIDDGADTHTCRRQVSEHARTRTCRRRERVRTVLKPSALAHTLTPSERPHTTAVFCLFYLHLTATISLALVFYEAKTKITSIEIYLQHTTTIMCHCRNVSDHIEHAVRDRIVVGLLRLFFVLFGFNRIFAVVDRLQCSDRIILRMMMIRRRRQG